MLSGPRSDNQRYGCFDRICVTQLQTSRSVPGGQLQKDLEALKEKLREENSGKVNSLTAEFSKEEERRKTGAGKMPVTEYAENVPDMMERWKSDRAEDRKLYFAAGSLYLVGEVLTWLRGNYAEF